MSGFVCMFCVAVYAYLSPHWLLFTCGRWDTVVPPHFNVRGVFAGLDFGGGTLEGPSPPLHTHTLPYLGIYYLDRILGLCRYI